MDPTDLSYRPGTVDSDSKSEDESDYIYNEDIEDILSDFDPVR